MKPTSDGHVLHDDPYAVFRYYVDTPSYRIGVSASLFVILGTALALKFIETLQAAENLSDLAKVFGYQPKSVSFILYKIPDAAKYTEFKIPKSGGGERTIKAPVDRLKALQRRLADVLQAAFEELYGDRNHGRSLSHGFRQGHSIITNASNHKNKRYVFSIDLEDFFPSINFGRVRGFFIKSTDFQLKPKVATVIAQIACHDNQLPQGSPVSPIISNLLGHVLDVRLVRLAKKAKCAYSRYADDITFSTREKGFPQLIAGKSAARVWEGGVA
jgi:RNA-directed DNA polymerase